MCINRSKLLIILVSHNILRKKVLLFIVESRVWSVECREGRGERGKVVIYTSYFLLIKKVLCVVACNHLNLAYSVLAKTDDATSNPAVVNHVL